MVFLSIIKILALIFGLMCLGVDLLLRTGFGFATALVLFAFAFSLDKMTSHKTTPKNKSIHSKSSKPIFYMLTILAGVVCFFGLYSLAAVGKLDTGGPNRTDLLISILITSSITITILYLINRRST